MLAAVPIFAEDLVQKMTARLAEEADAFGRLAPQVLGEETLVQRAQKPRPRFRPRAGDAAKAPPPVEWQERRIVSEYGFSTLGASGGALHELRRVVSVDHRGVEENPKAQDALVRILAMKDEAKEKELLKDFEKHGLIGAATDLGQLIMLFTPRDIGRYEFTAQGPKLAGAVKALVFGYRQMGGPEALTLFDARKNDQAVKIRIQGEVWVREENLLPIRVTMSARDGEGPPSAPSAVVQEEVTVDYEMSRYGALLPSAAEHRELRGGSLAAQNLFTYANFHKFGASSDIKFDVQP